jgi:hypothetical protein
MVLPGRPGGRVRRRRSPLRIDPAPRSTQSRDRVYSRLVPARRSQVRAGPSSSGFSLGARNKGLSHAVPGHQQRRTGPLLFLRDRGNPPTCARHRRRPLSLPRFVDERGSRAVRAERRWTASTRTLTLPSRRADSLLRLPGPLWKLPGRAVRPAVHRIGRRGRPLI